ncbi:hypothetical protein [Oceanobacillus polygoni]|uniref:Uncharacterized protein n=1 Tax=Oceanobacillus polygoni TaxID=1235259 RepID=A0A9X0YVY8_9BACI|nr:hypothetical protein [Oceanobacillus polygoni]MBP2077986.1 hypothetical protein [Oceanobacillus polygoni]
MSINKKLKAVEKGQRKGCGCGPSGVLKSRRLDGTSNTSWGVNQKPIKAKSLR